MKLAWLLAAAAGGVILAITLVGLAPRIKERIDQAEGAEKMFVYSEGQKGPSVELFENPRRPLDTAGQGSSSNLKVVVKGPRTIEDVMRQMELNIVSLRYWYFNSEFSVIDTAIITCKIRPDGLVEDVAITLSSTEDSLFKSLLIKQIGMFEFPQMLVAEKTDLHYPLYFKKGKVVQ